MDIRKPGSFEPPKVPSQESQQTQPSPKQSNQLGTQGIAELNDALEGAKFPDAFNSALQEASNPRQAIHEDTSKTENVSTGGSAEEAAPTESTQESGNATRTTTDARIGNKFYSPEYQDGATAWLHSSAEGNESEMRTGFNVFSGRDEYTPYVVAYTELQSRSGEDPFASVDARFGAFTFGALGYHLRVEENNIQAKSDVWWENRIGIGSDASLEDGQLKVGATLETQIWWYEWQPIGLHFDLLSIDTNEVKRGAEDLGAWLDEITPDSVDQFVNDAEKAAADAVSGAVHQAADAAQAVADTLQESADALDNFLDSVLG